MSLAEFKACGWVDPNLRTVLCPRWANDWGGPILDPILCSRTTPHAPQDFFWAPGQTERLLLE